MKRLQFVLTLTASMLMAACCTNSLKLSLVPSADLAFDRLRPGCAADLIGNPAEFGHVTAISLAPEGGCIAGDETKVEAGPGGQRDLVETSSGRSVRTRVVPIGERGFSLLRVSVNSGGSLSYTRYALVSATSSLAQAGGQTASTSPMVVAVQVFPGTVRNDEEARAAVRKALASR